MRFAHWALTCVLQLEGEPVTLQRLALCGVCTVDLM